MHHRCMYTWSRDICATSLCHLRLPEERRGEGVLVDVGRQDRHAALRLVPENGGVRRVLPIPSGASGGFLHIALAGAAQRKQPAT